MLRSTALVVALTIALAGMSGATEYIPLDLYSRVQGSDTIVLARIIDPDQARLAVERVFKGNPPSQITLVNYIDPQIVPDQRKELVLNGRELLFLTKRGDAYAPIQDQYGRLTVTGNRLVDSFKAEPRNLSSTLASIGRLISHQARADRGDVEADAAYVSALKNPDVELHLWALWTAKDRLSSPSRALVDAMLARWPKQIGPVYGSWNAAGLIANVFSTWRVERTAPFFARILTPRVPGLHSGAVAAARGRMPMEIRYSASSIAIQVMWAQRDIFELVRAAGCEGLTLGSLIIASPQSADHLRSVCRDVTDLVRAEALSRQPAQTLTREEADRRQWAVSMLKWLETPSSPAPAVYPHDRFPAARTVERLPEYVAAVIGFPGGHTERVKVELSGIARFGTHDTFRQLRKALTTAGDESSYAINEALQALAFEDEVHGPSDRAEELRRWDRWWQQHGGQSREQWAREAIAKRPVLSDDVYEVNGASRAAEYLLVLDRGRYERRLVTHPSWRVRVTAAITLAPKEPQYAAALLLREFENRYLSACFNAGYQLASLTGSWFPFQCSRPEERRAAAAHWTGLAQD